MNIRHSQSTTSTGKASARSPDRRIEMIQLAAFYLAERRSFGGRSPLDDWLEAEVEIDRMFQAESRKKLSAKQALQEKLEAQLDEWDVKLEKLKVPELRKNCTEYDKHSVLAKKANANKSWELRKHTECRKT